MLQFGRAIQHKHINGQVGLVGHEATSDNIVDGQSIIAKTDSCSVAELFDESHLQQNTETYNELDDSGPTNNQKELGSLQNTNKLPENQQGIQTHVQLLNSPSNSQIKTTTARNRWKALVTTNGQYLIEKKNASNSTDKRIHHGDNSEERTLRNSRNRWKRTVINTQRLVNDDVTNAFENPMEHAPITTARTRWKHLSNATSNGTAPGIYDESVRSRLKERIRRITQDRMTVRQIFRSYVETSTLHGFVYTCSDTYLIRRFLWACLMIMGAVYFLIKLKEGVHAYYSYPFTTLSTIEYVDASLSFPAVSFCPVNQFKRTRLTNSSLHKLFLESRLPLYRNWSSPSYEIPGDKLFGELKNVSLSIEDIFKDCEWIRRDTDHPDLPHRNCSLKNFTMYFSETGQVCYTLNSGKIGHKLLKVDQFGLKHGYEVMFDLNNKDVIPFHSYTGMQVIVHDQKNNPARDVGFLVSPGFKTYVQLQRKETKNLPPPFDTKCGSRQLLYHDQYSQKACLLERLVNYVGEMCKCREMFMPDNGLSYCSLMEIITCVYPAKESYNEFKIRQEDCPIDCHITEYETAVSETRFIHNPPTGIEPSMILEDVNKRNTTSYILHLYRNMSTKDLDHYIEHNIINIILFFGEMNKIVNVQVGTFGFYKLLGNMGGVIELMLGASLLTLVEFIDLLFFLIYHQLLRCWKRKQEDSEEGTTAHL